MAEELEKTIWKSTPEGKALASRSAEVDNALLYILRSLAQVEESDTSYYRV